MSITLNGTEGIASVDGTATKPGLRGTDTNSGVVGGANQVLVSTDGSERFRVASAGQLGIAGANYGADGQVLTSGGASAAPSWAGLPMASVVGDWTSCGTGTGLDITGFSTAATRHQLLIHELSFNADHNVSIRIGTGGTAASSGYLSSRWRAGASSAGGDDTDQMKSDDLANADYKTSWIIDFIHAGSNKWFMWAKGHCHTGSAAVTASFGMASTITLGGTLDIIQLYLPSNQIDNGLYRLLTWT